MVIDLAGGPLGITSVIGGPLSVAAGTASAALWSFFALVLGAAASIGAAYLAVGFAKSPEQVGTRKGPVARPAE